MSRLTIIARADNTGLGIQSRNWVRLLKPNKVVIIDSSVFNQNEQHPEWYEGYKTIPINGFIKDFEIDAILEDTDILMTFEIPYNYNLFNVAKYRGVKTVLQNNWEFTDYLQRPELPFPDALINHSYWHLDDQMSLWPTISGYIPTPLFIEDFEDIYKQNLSRSGKRRFLHVAGRKTYEDRNGTNDLIKAVELVPPEIEFELVIKTQTTNIGYFNDERITIDTDSPSDEKELYRDFDAMIIPRRYAGACLPMNEALAAGLPVIMTDIDPNNKILPSHWLAKANKHSSFMARTLIDVYSADHTDLAARIVGFAALSNTTLLGYKQMAHDIADKEYSSEVIKHKWYLLCQKLGVQ